MYQNMEESKDGVIRSRISQLFLNWRGQEINPVKTAQTGSGTHTAKYSVINPLAPEFPFKF